MEDRDPLAEARPHPTHRLRRERDLGDQHDRTESSLEHRRARLQVDLGLPGPRRAEQEKRGSAARVERLDDPIDRSPLLGEELGWSRFTLERLPLGRRRLLLAPPRRLRCDQGERPRRGGAVVVGDPEREVDERRRHLPDDLLDGDRRDAVGRAGLERDDDPASPPPPERHRHDRARPHALLDLVRERARDGAGGHQREDRGVRHPARVVTAPVTTLRAAATAAPAPAHSAAAARRSSAPA